MKNMSFTNQQIPVTQQTKKTGHRPQPTIQNRKMKIMYHNYFTTTVKLSLSTTKTTLLRHINFIQLFSHITITPFITTFYLNLKPLKYDNYIKLVATKCIKKCSETFRNVPESSKMRQNRLKTPQNAPKQPLIQSTLSINNDHLLTCLNRVVTLKYNDDISGLLTREQTL